MKQPAIVLAFIQGHVYVCKPDDQLEIAYRDCTSTGLRQLVTARKRRRLHGWMTAVALLLGALALARTCAHTTEYEEANDGQALQDLRWNP